MDIFEFADVDHISRFDQTTKHLKMCGNVCLIGVKLVLVNLSFELDDTLID